MPLSTIFQLYRGSHKVCQLRIKGRLLSPGTPVSSTNKTDCHDIAEILLKVALNTINKPQSTINFLYFKVH
jgi:hypothetical protein